MFNKNDPLIGAVSKIMEQNELRREVEKKLCEELGIYSRNALPNEHLANYDALLEQRLTEAKKEDKKPVAKLTAKDEKDKKIPNSMASYADRIYKARTKALRKEELVGNQHKIDANKNNKIDSHDFKLLRAKKTMKEEEQLDELKGIKKDKEAAKEYIKKASHDVATKSAATGRYAERANKEEDNRKKTGDYSGYRQGRKDNETADKMFKKSWSRRKYMAKAVDKLEEQEQDSKNPLPPTSAKERIQNKLGTGPKSSTSVSSDSTTRTQPSAEDKAGLKNKIDMNEASKSKAQQRLMGMALAMRRGESDRGSREVAKIATDMPEKELEKFAKTKHKGLPEKKKKMDENLSIDEVMEEIARNLGETKMKKVMEDSESMGYGSGGSDLNKPRKEQPEGSGISSQEKSKAATSQTTRAQADSNPPRPSVVPQTPTNLSAPPGPRIDPQSKDVRSPTTLNTAARIQAASSRGDQTITGQDNKPSSPPATTTAPAKQSFGQAFKDARARGETTFKFGDKSFNTSQKGETRAQTQSALAKNRMQSGNVPLPPKRPVGLSESLEHTIRKMHEND